MNVHPMSCKSNKEVNWRSPINYNKSYSSLYRQPISIKISPRNNTPLNNSRKPDIKQMPINPFSITIIQQYLVIQLRPKGKN